MSGSVLLVTFTGRRSGKRFTTPVRYVKDGNTIRSFSSPAAQWWRNFEGGADVDIVIKGKAVKMRATLNEADEETRMRLVSDYLSRYPADGVYHGVKVRRNKSLPLDELRNALPDIAIVEFK